MLVYIGLWLSTCIMHTLISFSQGWYIVTYALAIYLLNLFIAFLSPKFDPAVEDDDDEGKCVCVCVWRHQIIVSPLSPDGPSLPTKVNEEFKPFVRRLPEFKFWYLYNYTCTLVQYMY